MQYRITIEYDADDNIYVASALHLAGCATHGDTPAHAFEMLCEAIELHELCLAKEVSPLAQEYPPRDFHLPVRHGQYRHKSYLIAWRYIDGETIDSIARYFGLTRERVRQCLWKEYRKATK